MDNRQVAPGAMRLDRVFTNETCNQNCGFCNVRRASEQREFVVASAVRERIGKALRAGAQELVLTGGEPLLRRDLADLVAFIRASGNASVTLETNGALLDEARADALVQAGLSAVRVHLPAWGSACDEVTRDEGGFAATRAALHILAARGVPFEVSVPIVRANARAVAALPAALVADGLRPKAVVAGVPTEAPDESTLAAMSEATEALDALAEACRDTGLRLRLEPTAAPPPCLLPKPTRLAHLYAMTPGQVPRSTHARVDACGACVLADRCPGMPVGLVRRGQHDGARPVLDERTRRRLTLISTVEAQQARELVTKEVWRAPDGSEGPAFTVRVQFQCNQACHFCFVSTHLPPPEEDAVREAILAAGRVGAALQLSGGEPTLNERLPDYVRLAKANGVPWVELQTNAIRLADPVLVATLAEAGVDTAFVSLHGSRAEISDAVTNAPGTFERTVRGLDALAASPVALRLNFVFCELNRLDFPDYVRLAASRWPKAQLTVSIAGAFTDLVPRTATLISRHSSVLPSLEEGLALASRLGLTVGGWESMCSLPLCLVPEQGRARLGAMAEIPPDGGGGEFVKTEECGRCALERKCFGLRRSYVELHGTSELRAVTDGPTAPR